MTEFPDLISQLNAAGVRYIVIGGFAGILHGSPRLTQDLDVVYERSAENVARLVDALAPFEPYPRGAPPGLPFRWDARTVLNGRNFTLITSLGWIDLLGEAGGLTYDLLLPDSQEFEVNSERVLGVTLPTLIALKRAAGRPKDFEALAELEALWSEVNENA
jgi:hypothetical protein